MQQETPPTTSKPDCKSTPSRFRAASFKAKECAKPEAVAVNGSPSPDPKGRAKSLSPDVNKDSKARRSLALDKPKSKEEVVGSPKGKEPGYVRVVGRSEQFARTRRQSCGRNEQGATDEKRKELQEKLDVIEDLQSEVLALKGELDKAHRLNAELESRNKKLAEDLAASEAKVVALSSRDQTESVGEYHSSKFKDIQKIIANKLDNSKVTKDTIDEINSVRPSVFAHPISRTADVETKAPSFPSLPPPPPPPLPIRPVARTASTQKAPALVEFYHSLKKQEGKRDHSGAVSGNKPVAISAHSSIVGEIQNRSAHLLAIKADIETKGDFINGLIQKVLGAAYTSIEDVLKFIDWLDDELSSLADERAVLKHFNWPERKADAMREAAIEYRELKLLESEISSYKDDINIPCGAALKKMASLLDRSELGIQRLIKLRNSVTRSYQEFKIPTDWMLDSGIVSKIKQASMKLAKVYMKRVKMEIALVRNSDRESAQEALLIQGVHFAYRAHQFAGGLDSETLCAFEEIRQHVPGQLGGSQELLVGIPSS